MDFFTNEVPEVEAATRVDNTHILFSNGETSIQKRGVYADSSFFKVYVPTHLSGNDNRLLANRLTL